MVVNPEEKEVPNSLWEVGLRTHSSPQHCLLASSGSYPLGMLISVNPIPRSLPPGSLDTYLRIVNSLRQ